MSLHLAKMGKDELHVLMLPWSAFGHLIPFFQLSISLAKFGVHVSFVSTPKNILRLPKIPPNLQSLIQLVEFPLPVLEGHPLPEDAEATVDIPSSKVDYLKIAFDRLQVPLKQFIAGNKPDWLIVDMIPYWVVEIAEENRVPIVYFSVFSSPAYVFIGHPECLLGSETHPNKLRPSWESMTSPPEWVDFDSTVAYNKKEAIDVFQWVYNVNETGISDGERVYRILKSSEAVAIRACREMEREYIDKFQEILGKSVIPVGLLPPEKPKSVREMTDDSWSEVFKWLDQQKLKSVVFVGFGSEFKLSKDQIFEIAYGLELSGLPFLWILRKPEWANSDSDALPAGFSDRTSGKGIVSMGWAPQTDILGHPSIGGSLFHSGWGSIIEMLQFGHCLVCLPFIIDQPLNAKFLVEKGLGVEVERNEEDGSFTRDGICKALRLAMVSDESKNLRARASEAAEIVGNEKLQYDYYIAKFVQFLKTKVYEN